MSILSFCNVSSIAVILLELTFNLYIGPQNDLIKSVQKTIIGKIINTTEQHYYIEEYLYNNTFNYDYI